MNVESIERSRAARHGTGVMLVAEGPLPRGELRCGVGRFQPEAQTNILPARAIRTPQCVQATG